MLLKKVTSKTIGLFLGKVKKLTDKQTSWEKKDHPLGKKYYIVTVPKLDITFTIELLESGAVVQIPSNAYMTNKKNAKVLEAIFISHETGSKEVKVKYG